MSDHCAAEPEQRSGTVDAPEQERHEHREFLFRNIGFLIDTVAAEQRQRYWRLPAGCPGASPEILARRRSTDNGSFSCCYEDISVSSAESGDRACECEDPLCGSNDPLDALAAVIITDASTLIDHYFAHEPRQIIAALREEIGEWSRIAAAPVSELQQVSRETSCKQVLDLETASGLQEALSILEAHRYTDSIGLESLPSVAYEQLRDMLAELPTVDEADAWWVILTALEKPVWPAGDTLDTLLAELGLLEPGSSPVDGRHPQLEEVLSERRIPALHRVLAGHARYCCNSHAKSDCELCRFTLRHRLHRQAVAKSTDAPTVVDLFCGAGGLSHGFSRGVSAPEFKIAIAVDQDEHATDTYRLNHPEVPHQQIRCEDIGNLAENPAQLDDIAPDVDVVVGGPPCQALSVAGYRSRRADDGSYSVLDDPRTELYKHYVSLLETLEPKFIIMENVEGIRSPIGDNDRRVIDDVESALSRIGYTTDHRLLDCSEFGIPQERDRVILFGVRADLVPEPPQTVEAFFEALVANGEEPTTIRQALSNLPRLRRGEGGDAVPARHPGTASHYVRSNRLSGNTRLTYNHRARKHPMEKDRKLFTEVMEPGDTGWDVKFNTEYGHLIDYNVGTEDNPAFKDKYRMLHWDEPSPTIVAHLEKDSNSFILPDYYKYACRDESKQDSRRSRGITPREAARIQSFPDSYVFLGPFTSQFRQIGNAVPPLLGEQLASVLSDYIDAADPVTAGLSQPRAVSSDD